MVVWVWTMKSPRKIRSNETRVLPGGSVVTRRNVCVRCSNANYFQLSIVEYEDLLRALFTHRWDCPRIFVDSKLNHCFCLSHEPCFWRRARTPTRRGQFIDVTGTRVFKLMFRYRFRHMDKFQSHNLSYNTTDHNLSYNTISPNLLYNNQWYTHHFPTISPCTPPLKLPPEIRRDPACVGGDQTGWVVFVDTVVASNLPPRPACCLPTLPATTTVPTTDAPTTVVSVCI